MSTKSSSMSKSLLSEQLSGGSSVTSDLDRSSPSPLSMLEESHHYANPQELKKDVQVELDKIDGRKKKNLIYEPLPVSEKPSLNGYHKKNSLDYNEYPKHLNNDRIYRFLLVVVLLMSLGAFVLSVLTSFGVISSCGCKTEEIVSPRSTAFTSADSSYINEMNKNLSHLTNMVIPSLLHQISTLKANMANQSFHGIQGPPGPQGPQGPPGSGDLSKCKYKSEAANSIFHDDEETKVVTQTSSLTADKGSVVVGATCSTEGGSEHNLYHKSESGKSYYYCKCAGKSKTEAFRKDSLRCQIHLWECPIST